MTELLPREACPIELGEDTMELELTAEEELELARDAEAVDAQGPSHPDYETYIRERTRRVDLAGTVTFATVVLVGLTFACWRVLGGPAAPAAVAYQSPADPPVVPLQSPPPTFVRVVNPFDTGEVFELPAGVTETEARDAVAQALLQRARDRLQQGINMQPGRRTRAAAIVAGAPGDIVVTRVPRPVGPILD
jgi:hypothetical protein